MAIVIYTTQIKRPVLVRTVVKQIYVSRPAVISYNPVRAYLAPILAPPVVAVVRSGMLKYYVYDPYPAFVGAFSVRVEGGYRVVYMSPLQAVPFLNRQLIGTVVWSTVPLSRRKIIWQWSGGKIPPDAPPVVANPIPNQSATELAAFSYTVPSNTFADPDDAGMFFTYRVRQTSGAFVPSWLIFNPFTRAFSGTPPNGSAGTLSIRVYAKDTYGQEVSDDFNITIAAD
jgi:putative Ig domain-containing protein